MAMSCDKLASGHEDIFLQKPVRAIRLQGRPQELSIASASSKMTGAAGSMRTPSSSSLALLT